MRNLRNWGGLVLVLLAVVALAGCGGRGDDITSPPPPGDGGGNPGTYLDVLSGSTDSTVSANTPVRLSSPHPGWWHLIVWTNGANLRNVADQDRTHYVPTLGGALFPTDPVGYWRNANTMVFDFVTPPDKKYGSWYPLWASTEVVGHEPRAGEAWIIGGNTWNGNIVHPIEWVNGQPHWFTP